MPIRGHCRCPGRGTRARLSSDSCARPPAFCTLELVPRRRARRARAPPPARGTAARRSGRGAGMGAPAGASHTTRDGGPVGVCYSCVSVSRAQRSRLFSCGCPSCACALLSLVETVECSSQSSINHKTLFKTHMAVLLKMYSAGLLSNRTIKWDLRERERERWGATLVIKGEREREREVPP